MANTMVEGRGLQDLDHDDDHENDDGVEYTR